MKINFEIFENIKKKIEKDLIFEKDLKKIEFLNWKFDLTHKKQLNFKKFWKSQLKFSKIYKWIRKRYFFLFLNFNDEREKHQKDSMHETFGSKQMMHARTLWMSRWIPRTLWM